MLTCALPNFDSDDLVSFRTPAKSWTLFPVGVIAALLLLCSLVFKLQTLPTKSKLSLATEKGSGGPFGGALNNPLQDYHVVKVELKVLLRDTQMIAEDDFQDGHKQLFVCNS